MTFDSKEVNVGNLGEYIEYAKTLERSDADRMLSDDLPLDVLFQSYERVPDNVKYEMTHLTFVKYKAVQSPELLGQVLDLARTHPAAFRRIYDKDSDYKLSRAIDEVLDKTDEKTGKKIRTFEDNIYIAYALLDTERFYPGRSLVGRGDPITTLSKDKDKLMVDIFAISMNKARRGIYTVESIPTYHANCMLNELNEKGVLLNYDPKQLSGSGIDFDSVRSRIVFDEHGHVRYHLDIAKLDEKFILADKEGKLLEALVSHANRYTQYHSTRVMKTKEINRDDLMVFDKARKLVVQYAKQYISPYDSAKKGEEKSLSRQVEELCKKLWNMDDPNVNRDDVLSDAYLHAIYEDIKSGKADKLSKTAQWALITADKDAFWLKKMFEKQPEVAQKFAMEYRPHFAGAVTDVADYVINAEKTAENEVRVQSDGVVLSKHLTMAEKEKYLETEKAYVDKLDATEGRAKSEELRELQEKAKEYGRLNDENTKALNTKNFLENLQDAYDKILAETKDGKSKEPQGKEAYLSRENVEKLLMGYPEESVKLEKSDQKTLVLLGIGKGEKMRVDALNKNIDEFNRVLDDYRGNAKNSNLEDFKGRILDDESRQIAERRHQETEAAFNDFASMNRMNFGNEIAEIERQLRNIKAGVGRNSSRKQALDERKKHLENVVASRAVFKGESPLEPVKKSMSTEEKIQKRKDNKKVVDPLAAKAAEKVGNRR